MCLLVSFAYADDAPSWRDLPAALSGERINRVSLDPQESNRIYLLTANGLLTFSISTDGVTRVPRCLLNGRVNDVVIRERGKGIFAATDAGLQISDVQGKNWQSLTQGEPALAVFEEAGKIFVGTQKGLYVLKDIKETALRLPGEVGRQPIRILRRCPTGMLAVSDDSVYLIRPGEDISEMILKVSGKDEVGEVEGDASSDENVNTIFIRAVEVLEGTIYVVSSEGILKGRGDDIRWEQIPADGLFLNEISSLAVVRQGPGEPVLCVAGTRGIQCRLDGTWTSVNRGLGREEITSLQITRSGDLIAAGEGLFFLPFVTGQKLMAMANIMTGSQCQFKDYASLKKSFDAEPSIKDVQKMAIRYSDTDKAKIDAWQRQSRIKALVPSVSAGVNRNAGEFFHWDTGPNPDVLEKGREYRDWDVSVRWDLADMIWSTNQTSIDSRSKLTVELREQVLDQVTRLYFERRRIQIELASCRYTSSGERMAAEMRVDELTAHIDSYTGGEFSRKLNKRTNT